MRDVEIELGCQPERRQPRQKDKKKTPDYDLTTDCHPFWYIRRSYCVCEFNSAVVYITTKHVTYAPMTESIFDSYHHKQSQAGIVDFEIKIPCIVNTAEITCGTEIVLRRDNINEGQQTRNNKRVISAYSAGAPTFQKKAK